MYSNRHNSIEYNGIIAFLTCTVHLSILLDPLSSATDYSHPSLGAGNYYCYFSWTKTTVQTVVQYTCIALSRMLWYHAANDTVPNLKIIKCVQWSWSIDLALVCRCVPLLSNKVLYISWRIMSFIEKSVARLNQMERLDQLILDLGKSHYRYNAPPKYYSVRSTATITSALPWLLTDILQGLYNRAPGTGTNVGLWCSTPCIARGNIMENAILVCDVWLWDNESEWLAVHWTPLTFQDPNYVLWVCFSMWGPNS